MLVQCPSCGGTGTGPDAKTSCEHCKDGDFELTQCPYQFVGQFVELSQLCHLWTECGLPPVAGGVMDQAAYFVNAQRTLTAQKNAINAKEQPDVGRH